MPELVTMAGGQNHLWECRRSCALDYLGSVTEGRSRDPVGLTLRVFHSTIAGGTVDPDGESGMAYPQSCAKLETSI